jgi:hypothetical protein
MIYLYVKTHRTTGLKYLGKTISKNPHAYKGSGTVWKAHCKKYGYHYDTEIIFQSDNKDEIKEKGIHYSQLWNVVESKEWANLKQEECDGGYCANSVTPEANAKRSAKLKGRVITLEHRKKLSEANKGKNWLSVEARKVAADKIRGRKRPQEVTNRAVQTRLKNLVRKEKPIKLPKPVIVCPHCGKQGKHTGNMLRYHFDNCEIIIGPRYRKCDQPRRLADKTKKPTSWIITSPNNIQYTVTNMRQFCREHNLNNGSISDVAAGYRKQHKGWTAIAQYDDTYS